LTVTLLVQDGVGGSPELTSQPFTPTAGHTVLVVYALQAGGTPHTITLTAPGYTWNYGPTFQSADGDVSMSAAWAFNVPAGTVSFTTVGLTFDGITYFVLDLGGVIAQDGLGEQLTPFPSGTAAEVTTAAPLVQTGEVAVAWQQTQYTATPTPMPGWTTTQQQTNTAFSPLSMAMAYNAAAGTANSPLTGGWSAFTAGAGNAMLITFAGPSGGAGAQPGFPRSALIEEPSEGMQESNVTPPNMGTPN
jgi:hypothetical protein